ncbi:MAG: hypothetical protein U1E66_05830 [Rhodospirillales bacterium]
MQAFDQAATISLLQQRLADTTTGWDIGTFGAIAEFHHVAGDPPPRIALSERGGEALSSRGGIRVTLDDEVRPVAYESLTKDPLAWNHAVSFCLREEVATMGGRAVLTELGPDAAALRQDDRDAILFDVGVDAPQVDYCVRTADPALIATLRGAAGQAICDFGHPAMTAIIAASPHRIAISRLGRVEVYQPIPSGPDARSPIGPHTHMLPQLLRKGRSHSANAPIPEGWIPALGLYPPSPVADALGRRRPFADDAHVAFQALLRDYGPQGTMAEKQRVIRAVLAGERPQDYLVASTRAERKAARVALRQMLHTHPDHPLLPVWIETFDRSAAGLDAHA